MKSTIYKNLLIVAALVMAERAWPTDLLSTNSLPQDSTFIAEVARGPAVYSLFTNPLPNLTMTNSLGALVRRPQARSLQRMSTNYVFEHFLPDSLNYAVWTNVTARTNGRDMRIWTTRSHTDRWPEAPPLLSWNPSSLIWGMKGFTALCPCWEVEGSPGQVPITALTRRHGYARGHSMGDEGAGTKFAGKRVWFLGPDDKIFQTTVVRETIRNAGVTRPYDYTVLLFSDDLPTYIQPVRVISEKTLRAKYPEPSAGPWLFFMPEQTGSVSAGLPGFTVDVRKGGDSGSANLLPVGDELVFAGGRSCSGPNPEMQADMDELCRLQGLDPAQYQLQWFDFSKFPSYE